MGLGCEKVDICLCCSTFALKEPVNLFQLGTTKCRIYVGHSIIVANVIMDKCPSMRHFGLSSYVFGKLSKFFVLKQQHTTSTCCYSLVSVETDRSYFTECACMFTLIIRADTFCGVLNKLDVPLVADFDNFVKLHGMAECVHRHACFYAPSCYLVEALAVAHFSILVKPLFKRLGRQPHGVKIHIDENGMCPDVTYSIAGGNECQRLGEYLVVTFYAYEHHCHVKRICSANTYNGFCGSCKCRYFLLETINKWTYA